MFRKMRMAFKKRKELIEMAVRYRNIEQIVQGYNQDENVYDKYMKVVRAIYDEMDN